MSKVISHTLRNKHNTQVTIINYGAIIQSFILGDGTNIVLGFTDPNDYIRHNPAFLGASIGRLANRVSNGQFTIANQHYQLEQNEQQTHCLHSGSSGLHTVFWNMQGDQDPNRVILTYRSPAGEGGFPGTLDIKIMYELTEQNALLITYHAETDRTTPLDLTNHTYWNLRGKDSILQYDAKFYADHYLPSDAAMIPTGERATVKNTPLDFSKTKMIGADIQQLTNTKGYDHYFICNDTSKQLKLAAEISDPKSQRLLNVFTTEPGFQFYTGNFLPQPYSGFCIETQNYPDAINQNKFPSPLLHPGDIYHQETLYIPKAFEFSVL